MDVALACMPCEWFSDAHPPPAYMEVTQIVWRLKHHTVRDEVAIMQKNFLPYLECDPVPQLFVQIVLSDDAVSLGECDLSLISSCRS